MVGINIISLKALRVRSKIKKLDFPTNVITIVITKEDDMLALKIRKIGNSLGVVLPKETLQRLNVKEGETLYFTESQDRSYRLTAYNEHFSKQMAEAEEIMREDKDLLKALSSK